MTHPERVKGRKQDDCACEAVAVRRKARWGRYRLQLAFPGRLLPAWSSSQSPRSHGSCACVVAASTADGSKSYLGTTRRVDGSATATEARARCRAAAAASPASFSAAAAAAASFPLSILGARVRDVPCRNLIVKPTVAVRAFDAPIRRPLRALREGAGTSHHQACARRPAGRPAALTRGAVIAAPSRAGLRRWDSPALPPPNTARLCPRPD
eukprot:scaffold25490_cov109-Isochrysis_galbana.AAC.2